MIEPLDIGGRFQNIGRLREIEIEIPRLPRHRLVAPPEHEARNRKPHLQVLVLKPFLELGLAAGRGIVEDRQNAGQRV